MNLLDDIPVASADEHVEPLASSRHVRVERIVSHGHASPAGFWYDQPQTEFVIVLRGAARLRFEDDAAPLELKPGDSATISAHRRHRVEWTDPGEPTVWLALHYSAPARRTTRRAFSS